MSIFNINEIFDSKKNTIRVSNGGGGKKTYYPLAQEELINKQDFGTQFYRTQNNNTLLNLYKKINNLTNFTYSLDEHYSNSVKVVIYTPPIDIKCGGIMVLHNLAKTINDFGYSNFKAYLYSYDHKTYPNDFCNNFYNPFLIDDKTIVIYPETIFGNPLGAKNVVRWVLLDLGYEVPKNFYKYAWSPTDIVYHWEPSTIPNSKQLVNIWTNPSIKLTNNSSNRSKKCYAFKKVENLPKAFHKTIHKYHNPETDINIDKLSIEQAVETFNRCDTFYCYDPNTFFSIMAPLCGCVTVLHPIDGVDKESYFQSRITCHEPSGFCYNAGIAYGNDPMEIKRARETLDQAKNQYEKLSNLYRSSVNDLIQDMVNMINGEQLQNTVENVYYNNRIKKQS